MTERLMKKLNAPVDIASLVAFRVLFGTLMCIGAVRFVLSDWVRVLYVEPTFFFKYWGMSWVPVPPEAGIYALFAGIAVSALMIALGLYYRVATALFLVLFSYAQLMDLTNYLNHYYLVVLLALLLCVIPTHRAFSLDVRRNPALQRSHVPAWMLYLLRFQVGVVYFYAGMAKLGSDWLLHAQPLNIWLTARTDLPLIGALFELPPVAYAMAWAGFLYDTTIVLWLSMRRTRPYAYAVVIFFHTMTKLLFDIGLFPFIMSLAALVFFEPDWPRRLLSRLGLIMRAATDARGADATAGLRRFGGATAAAVIVYCAFQVLMPLRVLAYPGNVLWNEQGMRFSWRVMVREKHGAITYRVHDPDSGRDFEVGPGRYLNLRQEGEMSGQPDMILQLAHHIADDFAGRGMPHAQVRADAHVSLNGRPPVAMIDPDVDLARVRDGVARADWILPAPADPPIALRPPMWASLTTHRE